METHSEQQAASLDAVSKKLETVLAIELSLGGWDLSGSKRHILLDRGVNGASGEIDEAVRKLFEVEAVLAKTKNVLQAELAHGGWLVFRTSKHILLERPPPDDELTSDEEEEEEENEEENPEQEDSSNLQGSPEPPVVSSMTCNNCYQTFASDWVFRRHRVLVCAGPWRKQRRCPICDALIDDAGPWQRRLVSHVEAAHGADLGLLTLSALRDRATKRKLSRRRRPTLPTPYEERACRLGICPSCPTRFGRKREGWRARLLVHLRRRHGMTLALSALGPRTRRKANQRLSDQRHDDIGHDEDDDDDDDDAGLSYVCCRKCNTLFADKESLAQHEAEVHGSRTSKPPVTSSSVADAVAAVFNAPYDAPFDASDVPFDASSTPPMTMADSLFADASGFPDLSALASTSSSSSAPLADVEVFALPKMLTGDLAPSAAASFGAECPICELSFADATLLKIHAYESHMEARFICEVCIAAFPREHELLDHFYDVHCE